MSRLGLFNFLFAQWFLVRVFRDVRDGRTVARGVLGPVLPLTGWWTRYVPRHPTRLVEWGV